MFVSDEGSLIRVEANPVVGGAYSILELNHGTEIDHFGRYLNVDPPGRLRFTLDVPEHFAESTEINIELEGGDHGCTLRFTQSGIDPMEDAPVLAADARRARLDHLNRLASGQGSATSGEGVDVRRAKQWVRLATVHRAQAPMVGRPLSEQLASGSHPVNEADPLG